MTYKCPWGCTSYNALCDACDGYISEDNAYISEEERNYRETQRVKNGMDEDDWDPREEKPNKRNYYHPDDYTPPDDDDDDRPINIIFLVL